MMQLQNLSDFAHADWVVCHACRVFSRKLSTNGPESPELFLLRFGGHFAPARGGQFGAAEGGQFKSANSGQFDRRLQPVTEQNRIIADRAVPANYDFVVATYSQFNSPEKKPE